MRPIRSAAGRLDLLATSDLDGSMGCHQKYGCIISIYIYMYMYMYNMYMYMYNMYMYMYNMYMYMECVGNKRLYAIYIEWVYRTSQGFGDALFETMKELYAFLTTLFTVSPPATPNPPQPPTFTGWGGICIATWATYMQCMDTMHREVEDALIN